nr:zf-CCHC domain-containing protein/DUF4219 domain-containing protein/UBN2 domain-containing protein [Tanacetum cinerariifolium]
MISKEESIDNAFAKFNTIITSLKALDEARKESSDDDSSTSYSEDEEYAISIREFKKFFKRRGRFPCRSIFARKPTSKTRYALPNKGSDYRREHVNRSREERVQVTID